MSNKRFSDEEKQFIRDHYKEMTDREIAEKLGRSVSAVGIHRRGMGLKAPSRAVAWSTDEVNIVKEHYRRMMNDELLDMLPGKTLSQLYHKAHTLGLKKDEDVIRAYNRQQGKRLAQMEAAKANRFEKGHEPMNKGLPQAEYMSSEAIERTKATRFKEGDKPWNTKYDGAVTIRHAHDERGESPYLWIRLNEGEWVLYHRHLWEQKNGPIPKKHVLRCKDGDTLNPAPDNWELISRAENARRNADHEKMARTIREINAGKRKPAPMTDYKAAIRLAGGDVELKDYLMEHRPDLVRAAKANYKLQRKIRYGSEE